MGGFVAGLGPAKIRALVYLLAFVVFGALAIVGVLTLDDADRLFTLVGGALGMGTMGLSLRNIQKAPDVIDESGASVSTADPDGLGRLLAAVENLLTRLDSAGVAAPASAGPVVSVDNSAAGDVLAHRLELEARAASA